MYSFVFLNNVNLQNYNNVQGVNGRYIKFTYETNNMPIEELKYLQELIENDKSNYKSQNLKNFNLLMNETCFTQSQNCKYKTDSIDQEPINVCSKIFENSPQGDICYRWYANGVTKDASLDPFIIRFCNQFNYNECKCVSRREREPYKSIVDPPTFDDCWYRYCMDADRYLRTTEARRTVQCPNVCTAKVFIIAKDSTVTINKLTQTINCLSKDGKDTTPNVTKQGDSTDNGTNVDINTILIVVGGSIIILILIWFLLRPNLKSKKPK